MADIPRPAIVQQRKCWQADIEKARKELDRLAFREAKLSAELGEVEAERNLAQMYEEGRGTEKDLKKALEWYSTAAEQHNDMAADAVEMRNKPEVKPVLQDERLLSLLDDCHAFEDFPAMRQVMKEFASHEYLRDLYCRSQKDGIAECQLYADYVKKSLAQTRHFRAEFADYAVDSVFFALGLTDYVPEPSDHGFDPAAEDW